MPPRELSEQDLVNLLSKQHGVPSVNLDEFDVEPAALAQVPAELAQRHRLLPIAIDQESPTLVVAMADPGDVAAIDHIQRHTGFSVEVVVAASSRVRRAIDRYYFAN
ncbi:MAG: GspE/PulE/PilB domain-containing protein [Polyangia bacterium]